MRKLRTFSWSTKSKYILLPICSFKSSSRAIYFHFLQTKFYQEESPREKLAAGMTETRPAFSFFLCSFSSCSFFNLICIRTVQSITIFNENTKMIQRKGGKYTGTTYTQMLSNILLIDITHYFLLVTLTYIDKHIGVRILCEFEWCVIETRVYLRQLFHTKKK